MEPLDELERLKRWLWDVCTCQGFRPSDEQAQGQDERDPLLPETDADPIQDQPAGLTMPRHPMMPEPGLSAGEPSVRGYDALGPDEMHGPKSAVGDDEATPRPRLTRRPSVVPKRSSSLNEEDWANRGPPGPTRERKRKGKPASAIPEGQRLLRGRWRRDLLDRDPTLLQPQPLEGEAPAPAVDPEAERQAQLKLQARLAAERQAQLNLQARVAAEEKARLRAERHAPRRRAEQREELAAQEAQLAAKEADLAAWEQGLADEVAALGPRSVWQPDPPPPPGIRWRRAEYWIAGLQTLEEKEDFKEWKTYLEAWRQTLKTLTAEFAARLADYERRQRQVAAEIRRRAQEQELFGDELDVDVDDISSGSDLYDGLEDSDDDRPGRRAVTPEPEAEPSPAVPIVRGRQPRRPDADNRRSGSGLHDGPQGSGNDHPGRRAASAAPVAEARPAASIVRGRRPRADPPAETASVERGRRRERQDQGD